MQKEQKVNLKKLSLYLVLIIIFSCDINYPSIEEFDYVVNYFFEPNSFNYSMDFDFAIKVLLAEKIAKIVIENRNTKEFIELETKKSSSYFFSVLGKNVFYCKGVKFNFFSNTFNSFIADVRLFDAGTREYYKSFVVNTELTTKDLIKIHKIIYKDKNINALKQLGNIEFNLFQISKKNNVSNTKEINSLKNLNLNDENENYFYIHYIKKNSNLFFRLIK